jgi:arsenate reductase (thioredoxin)
MIHKAESAEPTTQMATIQPRRILFICTANAIRSQMAEAFVNQMHTKHLTGVSAGITPCGYIDADTAIVMNEIGIDMSAHRSKSLDEFRDDVPEITVTMSGTAYSECPEWLYKHSLTVHWGFEDVSGENKKSHRKLRDDIKKKIERFIALYDETESDENVMHLLRKLM